MAPDDDKTRTFITLPEGTVIGHYRIVEKIGSGGMGEVYLAEDTALQRLVALKFLPSHLCQDEDCRARFAREAQAAARLQHPNIVSIHEVGEFEGRPFMATEYAGEQTLRDLIGGKGVSVPEAINIVIQVCEGLQEAHNNGIVHRDIKPSNIVVARSGRPRIVDFGLATVQGARRVTKSGSTMGTIGYMSPEQLRGDKVDRRTDLFSLGVVLYELITGRNPFTAENEVGIQHLILTSVPEPMARYKTGVPEGLQDVVNRALEKDAEVRYQSAADMMADLRRLRRRATDPARAKTVGPIVGKTGWLRNRYTIVAAIVIVALAAFWGLYESGARRLPPSQKHLAVIPFVSLGGASASQTFCDGLMETLTSKLTQFTEIEGSLWVVPASEVRDEKVTSAGQARRVFGVTLAVTGSVQQYGDGLRVTFNLVDAETERQVRSTVVDMKSAAMSSLQDTIVTELAAMLDIPLRADTRQILDAGGTPSSRAYYSYVEGRGYLLRYESATSLDSAASLFDTAIKQDSSYALAYAGLGQVYWQKYKLSMDTRWVTPAIAKSSRALELNNRLAPVLVTLGIIHRGMGQYEEAVGYLKSALEIDSMDNEAYIELAGAYGSLGRPTEAEATFRKAVSLRPDYWRNYYYLAYFNINRGRRDDALKQTAIAESLAPQAAYPCAFLGGLYALLNMPDKAKDLLKRSIDLEPGYFAFSNLGAIYQAERRYGQAVDMYERALQLDDRDYRVWINLASMYKELPYGAVRSEAAYDSAIRLAEPIREVNPSDPLLLTYLADCYVAKGDFNRSLDLVRQAARLAPENVEIMVRAGLVYEAAGKRDEALASIGKAIDSGYPPAQIRDLDELKSLVSDPRFDSIVRVAGSAATKAGK